MGFLVLENVGGASSPAHVVAHLTVAEVDPMSARGGIVFPTKPFCNHNLFEPTDDPHDDVRLGRLCLGSAQDSP
jgi:hypothetical protein